MYILPIESGFTGVETERRGVESEDDTLFVYEWTYDESDAFFRHAVGVKHGAGPNGWLCISEWGPKVHVMGLSIAPEAVAFVEYVDDYVNEGAWEDRRREILARRNAPA